MNIPWWICHYYIEFSQYLEVKVSEITIYPLCMRHSFTINSLLQSYLRLLILFNVMNELTIRVMTSIQVWTVSKTFICILINNCPEMLFITVWMTFCLLTFISRAVITILKIFLWFEFESLYFFRKTGYILKLNDKYFTFDSMSIFSAKREGALSKLSIYFLCSFSLPDISFLCCWKVIGSGGGVKGLKCLFLLY